MHPCFSKQRDWTVALLPILSASVSGHIGSQGAPGDPVLSTPPDCVVIERSLKNKEGNPFQHPPP